MIKDIPKGDKRILELLSHIDEKLCYHENPIVSAISKPSGLHRLMHNRVKSWLNVCLPEHGKMELLHSDEHLLISEVVEFLGMHPERVKRLSEEARGSIEFLLQKIFIWKC